MKSFRKLVSEVAQPKAGDEIHFKAKHEVEKFPHSHAGDETFKGNTKKAPKRIADHEKGDDEAVYEAKKMDAVGKEDDDIDNDGDVDSSDKYLHARRKAISKAMKKEEAEELDEISRDLARRYIRKVADKTNTGELSTKEVMKRRPGVNLAGKKAYPGVAGEPKVRATEEVELDEARKSDSYQFTHKPGDEESEKKLADLKKSIKGTGKRVVLQGRLGKDNPNAHKYSKNAPRAQYKDGKRVNSDVSGKSGAHSHQRIQKADAAHHDVYVYNRNESVDLGESDDAKLQAILSARKIQKDAREKETGLKRKTGESRAAYASRVVNRRNKMQKEEVEQLDEISKKTLGSYIKKASQDMANNASNFHKKAELDGYKYQKYDRKKDARRTKGINMATDKLTKEEVEQLDELSPNRLHAYIKGASKDLAKRSRMSGYDDKRGNYDDGDKNRKRANKRMQGITSASGRLADKANADMYENWQEEIPMMMRQLEFIAYAAEEIMDYVEMAGDPEEWFQNKISGIHQSMLSMYAYAQGGRRAGYGFDESVELDEASDPRKVRDELKSQGKHKEAGEHAFKHDLGRSYGPHFGMRSSKNSAEMEYHKGYDYAKARAGKADRLKNEEVELDEAMDYDKMTTAELKAAAHAAIKSGDRNAVKAITAAANKKIASKGGTPVTKLTTDPKKLDALKKQLHGIKKEEVELDEATPTKKAITRALQGMKVQPKEKVTVKKAPWDKNEEVELDEVTRSAVKRAVNYVDAKGVTRYRLTSTKPVQHDEYGQEKIRESLEEAVKPGRLKLDDGATITVSKKDADLVNQMFNDLNAKNRKKMQDTMMSDKAGFDEIVGFAREAL